MENKKRNIISLILKGLLAVVSFNGVLLTYLQGGSFSYRIFLYFTIHSNLLIGIIATLSFIFLAIDMVYHKTTVRRWLNVLELVFTVSMLITGLIFTIVLIPTMGNDAWSLSNILTHLAAPVLAIASFLFSKRFITFKRFDFFYATIPLVSYLAFSLIGFLANWNFGEGKNYPYFFLNYNSSSGVFGFSSQLPYFMGSFYWIVLILALAIGLSFLLSWLANKINKREQKNG